MRLAILIPLLSCSIGFAAGPSELLWSDGFSGPAGSPPDIGKWTYDRGNGGDGWGNHELEFYTDTPEQVSLDGKGHLAIRASREAGRLVSSRIKTEGKFEFRYGKVEARIRLPFGQGIWPAFWMLGANIATSGWPACGEIDIMENIGREPSTIHATLHGPGYSGKKGISGSFSLPARTRFSDHFHVFSADWSPDSVQFSVDGIAYHRVIRQNLPPGLPWVFDHPFFLLLNLAVGGDWPGRPDATTSFPQTMLGA